MFPIILYFILIGFQTVWCFNKMSFYNYFSFKEEVLNTNLKELSLRDNLRFGSLMNIDIL